MSLKERLQNFLNFKLQPISIINNNKKVIGPSTKVVQKKVIKVVFGSEGLRERDTNTQKKREREKKCCGNYGIFLGIRIMLFCYRYIDSDRKILPSVILYTKMYEL